MLYNNLYENVLTELLSDSIDMVLIDLPYGTTRNKWDSEIDLAFIWKELKRLCKSNSAIVMFGQNPFSARLINSNPKGYRHSWVWSKKQSANFAVVKYMPLTVTEDILVFSPKGERVNYYPKMRKGKERYRGSKFAKTNGQGFGGIKQVYYKSDEYYPTNLLEFSAVSRKNSLHPSQKPVELLEYLIDTYSLPNQTVLDFVMGSGSVGEACLNLNRNFIGVEADVNYFQIAEQRINEYTKK